MTEPNSPILPDFVLPDLYKNHLVIVNEPSVANKIEKKKVDSAPKEPEFLGNNQKKITILVAEKEAVFERPCSAIFIRHTHRLQVKSG